LSLGKEKSAGWKQILDMMMGFGGGNRSQQNGRLGSEDSLVANTTREDLSQDFQEALDGITGGNADISAGNDEEPIAKNWVQSQFKNQALIEVGSVAVERPTEPSMKLARSFNASRWVSIGLDPSTFTTTPIKL
jgi:hypothetical protein